MKTFSIRRAGTYDVLIKADAFATNAQLQEAGFDTRFTNMQIEGYSTAASQELGNIQEIENRFQSLVALAQPAGIGLYVQDLNDSDVGEIELVAP